MEISVKEWIEKFDNGDYSSQNVKVQCEAGWYDWFCRDTSLANKTKRLAPMVKRIAKSGKINTETMYVWFKNNCPMCGRLYDDFRFADIETGDVQYTIVPSSGHECSRGKAEVWGVDNGFKEPLVKGTWKDVCNFFGV